MTRLAGVLLLGLFIAACERFDWNYPVVGWIIGGVLGLGVGIAVTRCWNFFRRYARRDDEKK